MDTYLYLQMIFIHCTSLLMLKSFHLTPFNLSSTTTKRISTSILRHLPRLALTKISSDLTTGLPSAVTEHKWNSMKQVSEEKCWKICRQTTQPSLSVLTGQFKTHFPSLGYYEHMNTRTDSQNQSLNFIHFVTAMVKWEKQQHTL